MAGKKFSPDETKHLEFIQDVITRMNSNSFQMKAWMVTLVSALLGIFASTGNHKFVLVAFVPTLIFWFLDTYYLWQERKFRGLYNDVAGVKSENKIKLFEMRPDLYKVSYWDVFGSITIMLLYITMIAILLVIYFFM